MSVYMLWGDIGNIKIYVPADTWRIVKWGPFLMGWKIPRKFFDKEFANSVDFVLADFDFEHFGEFVKISKISIFQIFGRSKGKSTSAWKFWWKFEIFTQKVLLIHLQQTKNQLASRIEFSLKSTLKLILDRFKAPFEAPAKSAKIGKIWDFWKIERKNGGANILAIFDFWS